MVRLLASSLLTVGHGTEQDIYFGKSKDILNDLRSPVSLKEVARQKNLQSEITRKLEARRATATADE